MVSEELESPMGPRGRRRLSRDELRERIYRRRYLIPNAVTVGSMFCGFLAIIYAASGRFEKASIAIAISILLDGLDGRVARKLNATSRFGVEFDSFADLTSFGVAPALLAYHWCFRELADEFGVAVTFFYALCAASRLARFNIDSDNQSKFTGLPSPGAAGAVAAMVYMSPVVTQSHLMVGIGTVVMISLGALMISRVEYASLKRVKFTMIPKWLRVVVGGGIALIWYNGRLGLLAIAGVYALSGPFLALVRRMSRKPPAAAAGAGAGDPAGGAQGDAGAH